jgi:GNAT superfamily N-acetyltransferase/RimJ/RimL family protein N-acetyltransferase
VHVDEVDARTAPDDLLARLVAIEDACWPETNPGEPLRGLDEAIGFYRHQPATHTSCFWLADVGFAGLYVHGPTATFLQLLVQPDRRRHGIGTALLAAAVARARELGVEVMHGHHATSGGAAFAAHSGFTDGQREVRSLLDLRRVELPEPRLPDGWTLQTWLRRVPDEHLDAFVLARGAMDDAPDPDGMDFPSSTAEKVRESEESLARRGREMRVTVALRADGVIGSFTELRVSVGSTLGFTDDTGTVREHRGRGLAKAVKAESLRLLRDDHPTVELVTTMNAEENGAMRHVNTWLGFVPSVVETTAALRL